MDRVFMDTVERANRTLHIIFCKYGGKGIKNRRVNANPSYSSASFTKILQSLDLKFQYCYYSKHFFSFFVFHKKKKNDQNNPNPNQNPKAQKSHTASCI